jgi:hypothetical protein
VTTQREPQKDDRLGVRDALTLLAGSPDDASDIDAQLARIARLTADSLAAATYVSVTAVRNQTFSTVAATSELALSIDEAQYADDAGPCLDALRGGAPVSVPDVDTTIQWPRFREAAVSMGLHASLSIPLFAGSGHPIAVLNIYGHDPGAMDALTARVWSVFDADEPPLPHLDDAEPGAGAEELTAALSEAFRVRSTIQRAVGIVIARDHCSADQAYVALRLRSVESGSDLVTTAAALLQPE